MVKKTIIAIAVASLTGIVPVSAQQGDDMLSILRSELDYNFRQLREQPLKPYFISYRVNDTRDLTLVSDMGVTGVAGSRALAPYTRRVMLVPQIRVGDFAVDNMKYSSSSGYSEWTVPADAKAGIVANIWDATETKYKAAVKAYETARMRFASNKTPAPEDTIPSFSKSPAEKYYESSPWREGMPIDTAEWQSRLNAVTRIFRNEQWLSTGKAVMKVVNRREYIVNTDGTEIVQNHPEAYITLLTSAYTKDNRLQSLNHTFFAFTPDSLPSQAVMEAKARELVQRVGLLLSAPRGIAYTGPAILSGAAAGVLFHEVLGHRIEGHRYADDAETFGDMPGTQVLPKSFSVVSDPTLRSLGGKDLNGFYAYDDEGVRAQRVECIKDGKINDILMSRIPAKDFRRSNGHGRTAGGRDAVARQSNLISTTSAPVSDSEMRARLIQLCRSQGKEYGYYIRSVNSGYTLTGEDGGINSFKVQPTESYRVYVDGRPDELVRDLQLIGTPLNVFSNIVAGGSRLATFVGECGAESGFVPVSSSAPAILVSKIETQAGGMGHFIKRTLDTPVITENVAGNDSTIIFRAMEDEMKRQMDSLVIDGQKPFMIKARVNRCRSFSVESELGGTISVAEVPFSTKLASDAVLGNYKLATGMKNVSLPTYTTATPDYFALRRALSDDIGNSFSAALTAMSMRKKNLKDTPLSAADTIPSLFPTAPIDYTATVRLCRIDGQRLQTLADRLSAMFLDTPQLYGTSVNIKVNDGRVYTLTTEGVRMIQPMQDVSVTVNAKYRTKMQTEGKNSLWLTYRTPDEIPSEDSLRALVTNFIADCEALRTAPPMDKYYDGPLMLEDWVLFQTLRGAYLSDNKLFAKIGPRKPESSFGEKIGFPVADKRLTFTHYTTLTDWNGTALFGHYDVDADGARPASKLTLIENGIMRNLLSEGYPAWFCGSNTANKRYVESSLMVTTPGYGTIAVTVDKKKETTPQRDMTEKLIAEAKKQGLDCAYVFSQPQNITAARIYRVDLKTGERTMMMTNRATLPSDEKMKNLLCVSAEQQITNYAEPYPFSLVYPKSVILTMPVRPSNFIATAPFILPYPLQRAGTDR